MGAPTSVDISIETLRHAQPEFVIRSRGIAGRRASVCAMPDESAANGIMVGLVRAGRQERAVCDTKAERAGAWLHEVFSPKPAWSQYDARAAP
jgi:hypothetical protein